MIKLVDYKDLKSLIINENQNKVGNNLLNIYNEFGKIETIEDIERFCYFIKNSYKYDSSMMKFERTSEEIAESKIWSGCSDFGTIIAPILRMNGIPTVYVQTAHINWINDYQKNYEHLPITGHIFLEVCVDNIWYLLDANNGILYLNYNKDNCNLPNGFIAFSKSLSGHQVGSINNETNRNIMHEYFKEYNTSTYNNPEYSEIRFFDIFSSKTK